MSDLPGMNRVALERFLRAEGIDVDGELTVEMISGGRSNLTYKVYDDTSTWVVRRPPTSGLTPSAHDMAREWAVTDALASTAVPVAETVAFDREGDVLGAPMTVVRFVPGHVVRTREDLRDLTDEQVTDNAAELVRVLAELHAVDPAAVGLEKFGRPDGFVARQVATWARQWQTVKTRELPDVDRLHRALEAAVPTRSAASIVHGDFRVDNTILDAEDVSSVAAVVDWEMSTLGDPLTDVALMCVYRQPVFDAVLGADAAWTSDRYPSAADLVQQYAVRSGREVDNWGFYVALANFKLGVIGEGITHRALSGSDTGAGARNAAEATGEFIAAGLRALSEA
ncbi:MULTISPECIES: phosphotransferase family protein [Nocardiaceae]|uniref:phosphotransferase family protein n=1 Tax=Nocardiaceae TaxID=85025 RepID=UPI0019D0202A|nr:MULTISPECIES: phosphotransferase family protein [Rhodococcus]MBW4778969.1 phosphotransferase family protein [Rhodococcus fascians]MDJ0003981.1 phosphotransferase family protein [Rhodococcus fascians]MDJ0470100.1 phosphotransferase family protein [Rhodococcus fascians]WQH27032.1 phosphotransferase family protein [Rhodococcus fascians]